MGEVRRVASWRQLFHAVDAEVVELSVTPDRRPHLDGMSAVIRSGATPERLAWSGPRLRERLHERAPDAVLVVSTRAYDARAVAGPWTVVVDQVDSLARSYHDRAAVVEGRIKQWGYRGLSAMHARVEQRLRTSSLRRVAAGWSDALALGAEWIPNLVDESLAPTSGTPDRDVVFFGTLRYPPNIEALERLARCWPLVQARRPGTTAMVAGAAPTARVEELCREHDWELVANFASLSTVAARTRVAVAPLSKVAGIQNKVLDAASVGLAQVVTPEALEGFGPGLPIEPAIGDAAFVEEVTRLLDDPASARTQVRAMQTHIAAQYSVDRWAPWAATLLAQSDG